MDRDSISARLKLTTTPENENVIESFQLTLEELAEVETFASRVTSVFSIPQDELESIAKTTSNAGMQYLLLDGAVLTMAIVNSEKLDARVVASFLDRLAKSEHKIPPSERDLAPIHFLLYHKVVVADAKLFKQAWALTDIPRPYPLSPSQEAASDFANLYYALNATSTEANGENVMSMETLLLILSHLHRQEKYGIDPTLEKLRTKVLHVRSAEIKEWVGENMPDLVGLPLSWVLEVYDLYD